MSINSQRHPAPTCRDGNVMLTNPIKQTEEYNTVNLQL